MDTAETKIRAARSIACALAPYIAPALWRMRLVADPRCLTMGVSDKWTCYYSPKFVEEITVKTCAAVLIHEAWHLLREHSERAKALGIRRENRRDRALGNIAEDMEINDGIPDLPPDSCFPKDYKLPEHKLWEWYYEQIKKQADECLRKLKEELEKALKNAKLRSQLAEQTQPSPGETGSGTAGPGEAEEQESQPGGAAGQSPAATSGGSSDSGGNDVEDEAEQEGAGSDCPDPDQGDTETPAVPASEDMGDGGGEGKAEPQPMQDWPAGLKPQANYGGSCADGIPRHWEVEDREAEKTAPSPLEKAQIIASVAEATRKAGSGAGDALRAWAEGALKPKPLPWRQILAAECRRAVAFVAGQGDFTWQRPSRRCAGRPYFLPAIRAPKIDVAVIVDTSGSISDQQIVAALSETQSVLEAAGGEIRLIACDSRAYDLGLQSDLKKARNTLTGGGGTDMGVGIALAESLKPKPQVIVTITDGYTPWPSKAPAARHVCVLLDSSGSRPAWGRTVEVSEQ